VIVATQVLESMRVDPRPTRAEVSDAANAVAEGADAIMLAGETAVGAWPARTVQTLSSIITEAEHVPSTEMIPPIVDATRTVHGRALCEAAVTLATVAQAQAIIAVTREGKTARMLAALRPPTPILAATASAEIAGTLTLLRGVTPMITPERDIELADEMLADPKEQAEHLMLVDLARNDLSKVCVAGTVEVTEYQQVERFSHIMHLVSSVEGDLRPDASSIDVFRATFPAGTLSGAPKPRALEIIDELEVAQRGVYGGVVGYFGLAGDADLAIAIRTATIVDGLARVQAGAGLVADSDPATEHQEAQNKAAAPLRAVAIANAMRRLS
jgi:hypothetical protein